MAKLNFKFEDAPNPTMGTRGRPVDPAEIDAADQLRQNPGKEARLFETDKPDQAAMIAQSINRSKRSAFKSGGFKARSRSINGAGVVFVTFTGE